MRAPKLLCALLLLATLASCETYQGFDDLLTTSESIRLNPYKRTPLGAELSISTKEPTRLSLSIKGEIPVEHAFGSFQKRHTVPVLGLYPNRENKVEVSLELENGKSYSKTLTVKTAPLPDVFPEIEVVTKDRSQMEEGFHLVDMLIANNGKFLSYSILFDDNGEVRWFLDMSEREQITYSGDKNAAGNWLYMDWIDVFELNDLGKEMRHGHLFNFAGNHHIEDAGGGRWLFGGSRKDAMGRRKNGQPVITRFDHVVEWDYLANKPLRSWDLAENLDMDRGIYKADYTLDFEADWYHLNSILQTPEGDILVSGRNQGVLKVDPNNKLKWILSPDYKWGKTGRDANGFDPREYVLTALDAAGNPLPQKVQQGLAGTDEFEWSTGQHALNLLPNGNVLLFDNGLSRNFAGKPTYSRAVEYRIDEENRTIQQVWQYGKERGLDMHSPITSDVDVLEKTGNRLIIAGNVRASADRPHGKVIEITHPENKVVFEAKVYFKDLNGSGAKSWAQFDLVFKGARYQLYQ